MNAAGPERIALAGWYAPNPTTCRGCSTVSSSATATAKTGRRASSSPTMPTCWTAPTVLVWSSLSTHASKAMRARVQPRPWLSVHRIPAYAPELDPVEALWSP